MPIRRTGRCRPLPAALLLAEILTHTGRRDDAAAVLAELPPDSLTPSDREALTYWAAVGQGLMTGDTSGGAELVAALATGGPAASSYLHALHASMLTFDARLRDGLAIGLPIMTDEAQSPQTRTMAALAAVGAQYWLGRTGEALAHADVMAAVTTTPQARQAVPYGAASIELIAVCALLEQGDLDAAEQRSQRMRRERARTTRSAARGANTASAGWPWPAERPIQPSGGSAAAWRRSARSTSSSCGTSILARAAAMVGDLGTAASALQAGAGQPRMKPYEPGMGAGRGRSPGRRAPDGVTAGH